MKLIEIIQNLDYKGIIAEYVIHNSLDIAIERLRKNLLTVSKLKSEKSDIHFKSEIEKEFIEEKLGHFLIETFNYTKDITFRDLDTPKFIFEAFVDSHFFRSQRRTQVQNSSIKRLRMEDVFSNCLDNLIILGDLGAGKTTLVKKLCQNIFDKQENYYPKIKLPILIRLRELNNFKSELPNFILFEFIIYKLGLNISDFNKEFFNPSSGNILNLKKIICEFIEDMEVLLMLDGYDEINNKEIQKIVIEDFETISNSLFRSKLIITSRTVEFEFDISNTKTFEIAPLNDEQIDLFIKYYLGEEEEAKKFRLELFTTPYFDTSRKPLALAHLCAIYERYGSLPPKPKSIYKKIVNLYIEEWDTQRRIERNKKGSKSTFYNNLPNDRKFEFIVKFAYLLTTQFGNGFTFSEKQIFDSYNLLCDEFDLPRNEVNAVVKEIEGHNGLIIQSSFESFEFSHKSIHEYLTAEYISRMGTFPRNYGLLLEIPNELAIATALSTEPNTFLFRLILKYLKINVRNQSFINVFLNRIQLEKPDFRAEPIVGLIFGYIYTIVKFKDLSKINKNSYYSNEEIDLFLKIFQAVIRQNENIKKSISQFLLNYEMDTKFIYHQQNIVDNTFVRLRKLANIEGYSKYEQPEIIVFPTDLL